MTYNPNDFELPYTMDVEETMTTDDYVLDEISNDDSGIWYDELEEEQGDSFFENDYEYDY